MKTALSFIIPVYNVEAYLQECVQSILCQIEPTCEIILVDDGSTDESGKICDHLASAHPEVKVIHKENGGLSSARNAGVDLAQGAYIAFVDSDDRIAPKSVKTILDWISSHGADLCFMEATKFFPNGHTEALGDAISFESIRGKSKDEVIRYLSTRPKFPGSACTKIIRKQFLEENNIRFPIDRRLSEDLGYVLNCILAAQKYDALSIPYYEYRQNRDGSITHTTTSKSYEDVMRFVRESTEMLTDNGVPMNQENKHLMAFVAYEYSLLLWHFCRLEPSAKGVALSFLRKYRWVLACGTTKRLWAIRLLCCTLGIHCTSVLLELYMNRRKKRNTK